MNPDELKKLYYMLNEFGTKVPGLTAEQIMKISQVKMLILFKYEEASQ